MNFMKIANIRYMVLKIQLLDNSTQFLAILTDQETSAILQTNPEFINMNDFEDKIYVQRQFATQAEAEQYLHQMEDVVKLLLHFHSENIKVREKKIYIKPSGGMDS